MHLLNHSMLKSNSLERISGELLTRSFSYSALRTYMHIPTKKLLTPLLGGQGRQRVIKKVPQNIDFVGLVFSSGDPYGTNLLKFNI